MKTNLNGFKKNCAATRTEMETWNFNYGLMHMEFGSSINKMNSITSCKCITKLFDIVAAYVISSTTLFLKAQTFA